MANNKIVDKALAYIGNNMQTKSELQNMFAVDVFSISFSVSNGLAETAIQVEKAGYTPIAVAGWALSTTWYFSPLMRISGTTLTARIRHMSNTSASETIGGYVYVLYVKNS